MNPYIFAALYLSLFVAVGVFFYRRGRTKVYDDFFWLSLENTTVWWKGHPYWVVDRGGNRREAEWSEKVEQLETDLALLKGRDGRRLDELNVARGELAARDAANKLQSDEIDRLRAEKGDNIALREANKRQMETILSQRDDLGKALGQNKNQYDRIVDLKKELCDARDGLRADVKRAEAAHDATLERLAQLRTEHSHLVLDRGKLAAQVTDKADAIARLTEAYKGQAAKLVEVAHERDVLRTELAAVTAERDRIDAQFTAFVAEVLGLRHTLAALCDWAADPLTAPPPAFPQTGDPPPLFHDAVAGRVRDAYSLTGHSGWPSNPTKGNDDKPS